jgi:serine/threonine-protein kinase
MASVWCAHDRLLRRRVAIKVLAQRFAGNASAGRRFQREARAAAMLSGHPHVITIFDVGDTIEVEARAFIVMEYLAGGTVADWLRLQGVGRHEAVRWLGQAGAALDYAHRRGVLHRDIKPANMLLDRDRMLHLADFGIAQLGSDDTTASAGQVLGTAAYLAPERALGNPATEASDRYSLAVAAFELLVGERPFTARHFAAQARQHVEGDPPSASGRNHELPVAVDAVLARGMAKRAEDRWPSGGSFADALAGALFPGAPPAGVKRPATTALGAGRRPERPPAARSPTVTPIFVGPAAQRQRPHRLLAAGALAAAAFGVGVTVGTSGPSPAPHARLSAAPAETVEGGARHIAPPPAPKPARHPRSSTQVAATPAAETTLAPSADALEARGHALMEAGDYAAAIAVLRQAVAAATPAGLTYAYALFDLGRSLRLGGDPRAAAPILWQRLQIPNQTETVRQELQRTLLAIGESGRGSNRAHPPPTGGAGGGPSARGTRRGSAGGHRRHHGPTAARRPVRS